MTRGQLISPKQSGTSWMRLMLSNSTQNSGPTLVNTVTEPVTVNGNHLMIPTNEDDTLAFSFFGEGANDSTFTAYVFGWSQVFNGAQNNRRPLWKPTPLATLTCTLSQSVGVANSTMGQSQRDVDTIVASTPMLPVDMYSIISPANDTPALFTMHAMDFQKIGVYFNRGSSATSCNALYRWVQTPGY